MFEGGVGEGWEIRVGEGIEGCFLPRLRCKSAVKRQIGCLGTPKLGLKGKLYSFDFDADR